jgi:hypothetical protein
MPIVPSQRRRRVAASGLVLSAFVAAGSLRSAGYAQSPPLPIEDMPLAQYGAPRFGDTVTPVYEGWYANPDGSFTIYFGYYNRNTEEVVEIPVGDDNRIDGVDASVDHGQPSRFEPGRHWGVFGVRVPPDFGKGAVLWRLSMRGRTFEISGQLKEPWSVPAITGDAMGNLPPRVWLEEGGPVGFGPLGVRSGPRPAAVGQPVSVRISADDDGTENSGRPGAVAGPVTLSWFVHRGPGEVAFSESRGRVPNSGGAMITRVTFNAPGTYVLRVQANDDSGFTAGYEQCCWTNGFVEFTVTR